MISCGSEPSHIGEKATFTITFTPPSFSPSLVAAGVTATITKPDGTTVNDTAGLTQLSSNYWSYVQTGTIDQSGYWRWTVASSAGFVAVDTVRVKISRF